ncbi:hypothetical protein T11_8462 [Trichinella zimbabwensis]|uniref:Uncharacterized protein n=1 Tax=Trichinella zimbabwensis TaxID=268475 RepID=A0A0V1HZ86_9BILA|nr:hypothetical protein T11_8462 [Trichinella zimbabwensis]
MTLAKVGKATLHLSVGKVALNGWYQGGLKSQTHIIRSSWTPSSSAFKYLAVREQIFSNCQVVDDR